MLCQYNNIYTSLHKYLKGKKKKTDYLKKKKKLAIIATVLLEQTKSIIIFKYSPDKCHNIFTKYLFSIIVGHSFIFYYFILTYKKLTPQ